MLDKKRTTLRRIALKLAVTDSALSHIINHGNAEGWARWVIHCVMNSISFFAAGEAFLMEAAAMPIER